MQLKYRITKRSEIYDIFSWQFPFRNAVKTNRTTVPREPPSQFFFFFNCDGGSPKPSSQCVPYFFFLSYNGFFFFLIHKTTVTMCYFFSFFMVGLKLRKNLTTAWNRSIEFILTAINVLKWPKSSSSSFLHEDRAPNP